MTYSLVNANTMAVATSGTTVTPTCVSTTAGNLLVIAVASGQTITTVTLPAGWVNAVTSANNSASLWYYPNCPAGITSVIVTASFTVSLPFSAQIMEFHDSAGTNTSPLDVTGIKSGVNTTPVAIATTSVTTAAHELAVTSFMGWYASATKDTVTAGSGFTQEGQYGAAVKQQAHFSADAQLDTGAAGGVTVTDSVAFTGPFNGPVGVIATFRIFTVAPVVLFDAVGPSSAGAGNTSTATLSWTHTVGAGVTNGMILVGYSFDLASDAGITATCAVDGSSTGVVSLGKVESDAQTAGFLQVWKVTGAGAAPGAHTILVTPSSAPADQEAGSISFSNAGPTGTPVTNSGTSATASAVVASNTTGNQIVAFTAVGDTIVSSANTSRFIKNQAAGGGHATGNAAGSSQVAPGSSTTMSWTLTGGTDPWAVLAVEVQPPAAPSGLLPQQVKHRAPALWTRITHPGGGAAYTR